MTPEHASLSLDGGNENGKASLYCAMVNKHLIFLVLLWQSFSRGYHRKRIGSGLNTTGASISARLSRKRSVRPWKFGRMHVVNRRNSRKFLDCANQRHPFGPTVPRPDGTVTLSRCPVLRCQHFWYIPRPVRLIRVEKLARRGPRRSFSMSSSRSHAGNMSVPRSIRCREPRCPV